MPNGAGWYVVAVEYGEPRELTGPEDRIVDDFRFGRISMLSEKECAIRKSR